MWQIFFILNLSWLYYHYYHYYIYFALKISRNCTIGFAHLCTSDEDFGLCIAFFKFFKCVFFSTILFLLPIYLPSRAAAVFNFPADKKKHLIISYSDTEPQYCISKSNNTTEYSGVMRGRTNVKWIHDVNKAIREMRQCFKQIT